MKFLIELNNGNFVAINRSQSKHKDVALVFDSKKEARNFIKWFIEPILQAKIVEK